MVGKREGMVVDKTQKKHEENKKKIPRGRKIVSNRDQCLNSILGRLLGKIVPLSEGFDRLDNEWKDNDNIGSRKGNNESSTHLFEEFKMRDTSEKRDNLRENPKNNKEGTAHIEAKIQLNLFHLPQ